MTCRAGPGSTTERDARHLDQRPPLQSLQFLSEGVHSKAEVSQALELADVTWQRDEGVRDERGGRGLQQGCLTQKHLHRSPGNTLAVHAGKVMLWTVSGEGEVGGAGQETIEDQKPAGAGRSWQELAGAGRSWQELARSPTY